VVGGIEKQNYELSKALGQVAEVTLIANTRGKAFLPVFFFTCFFKALYYSPRSDVVLLGDGVLAPIGWLLKVLTRRPVCSIVHGLDITYGSAIYQSIWVRFFLARLDQLIAVGNEAIRQAGLRGIDPRKCKFVPNGVSADTFDRDLNVESSPSDVTGRRFYVLTLGRLVERKGVQWFVDHVVPRLPDNVHYWIAGDGPCRNEIEGAVSALNESDRVTVFGEVSDLQKRELMHKADLFVQPNILVAGDMEGFGLVVLEAAAAGLPVVASELEGLIDAVDDGVNGILVESGNADAFSTVIADFAENPEKARVFGEAARVYTLANCQWDVIAKMYLEVLERLAAGSTLKR
jgi:phosphatidyl-myo-inositol dimannoside synthase